MYIRIRNYPIWKLGLYVHPFQIIETLNHVSRITCVVR